MTKKFFYLWVHVTGDNKKVANCLYYEASSKKYFVSILDFFNSRANPSTDYYVAIPDSCINKVYGEGYARYRSSWPGSIPAQNYK